MDTSEAYIKMCDCPEIQGLKQPLLDFQSEGEHWWRDENDDLFFIENIGRFSVYATLKPIWLPTQSDLQEMVRDKYPVPWVLIKAFARKVYWTSADTAMSMEQLWLAFVMMETYSKQWLVNSQEWVKI